MKFEFNWKLSLFALIFLPITVSLGVWQLQRAEEKKLLLADWTEQQGLAPIAFNPEHDEHFRRVTLSGEYLTQKYWLKENQMLNGQLGYHVIMPFKLSQHDTVIVAVDRGWIEGSPLREHVPDIVTPTGELTISGALVNPSDSKFIREAEVRAKTWPHKILEEDLSVMSQQLGQALFPKVLRIDPESPGALTIYWRPVNMSSAKHTGYAVQWFAMAFALVVLYMFASTNLGELIRRRHQASH